jgi:alpha-glucosidase (family GH31 glycosyl hydrolase)
MDMQPTTVQPENLRFIKVQEFFEDSGNPSWQRLKGATEIKFDEAHKRVDVSFTNADGAPCTLLLYFLGHNIIRKRFHPGRATAAHYPLGNKRTVVMDSVHDLASALDSFQMEFSRTDSGATIKTLTDGKESLWLELQQNPFRISFYKFDDQGEIYPVLRDWDSPIRYRKRIIHGLGEDEYSVIQSFAKPAPAKYIGFGEKGGLSLIKNMTQLSYFNYDNMRYRQIYNRGPLCDSEPLYHTDTFFLEFGGSTVNSSSCYGIFIDNSSETYADVGYTDTRRYEFGSLYGELDFYLFFGGNSREVMEGHAEIVGHSRLKPRYALGYHQGCYGYDDREKVIQAALKHRHNQIPLDGIHIDVDIQYQYQTFTVNDERYQYQASFADPVGMFGYLKSLGVKCSTNITPIVSNRGSWSPVPYKPYSVASKQQLLVTENRNLNEIGEYQNYGDGNEWWGWGNLSDVRTGEPYVGEVYYGGGRGTTGSYYDLGKSDARLLWGEQYRHLYDLGLEMVWQDMTTPAIRDTRGDMKSFPFALRITDNFQRKYAGESNKVKARQSEDESAPVGTVRNLYSYNLHKATYHGLNNLGMLSPFSIIAVDENRIGRDDAEQILEQLCAGGYLTDLSSDARKLYKVPPDRDLSGEQNLSLQDDYSQYNDSILNVLRLCQRLEAKRGNTRNFIVGRGGFTGLHRFAALWTGDNASTWDFMKMNISQVLALGISGQPLSGQDIGGFEQAPGGGKWIDPELLIRWIQVGAFLPWFRNHYIAKGVKDFQEVYAFQEVIDQIPQDYRYMYEAVLPVCRHYIGLRYRLMQLFYDALFENTLTGVPITRPLFLSTNTDAALFNDKQAFLNDQFLVRNDVLVAPILFKQYPGNSGIRDIYLPAGSDWFCYMDNRQPLAAKISGGMTFRNFDATISTNSNHIPFTAPLFIRSGAIIPTLEQEQFVGEYRYRGQLNPITLNIYPGLEGEYTMYLDDGISRSSAPAGPVEEGHDPLAKGEYREVKISHSYNQQGMREINLTREHDNFDPMAGLSGDGHYFYIAILHAPEEGSDPLARIRLSDGSDFGLITGGSPEERARRLSQGTENCWYYNENISTSFAKFFDREAAVTLVLEPKQPQSAVIDILSRRIA